MQLTPLTSTDQRLLAQTVNRSLSTLASNAQFTRPIMAVLLPLLQKSVECPYPWRETFNPATFQSVQKSTLGCRTQNLNFNAAVVSQTSTATPSTSSSAGLTLPQKP